MVDFIIIVNTSLMVTQLLSRFYDVGIFFSPIGSIEEVHCILIAVFQFSQRETYKNWFSL